MNMFIKGMPKIIENAKDIIMEAAREELEKNPSSFSMRKIALKTKIAVGTIYHYFPDKLSLVAMILLEEWNIVYMEKKNEIQKVTSLDELIEMIFNLVNDYKDKYRRIYTIYDGKEGTHDYLNFHSKLVMQLVSLLEDGFTRLGISKEDEVDRMIVEMIMVKIRDDSFDMKTLKKMIARIIGGN